MAIQYWAREMRHRYLKVSPGRSGPYDDLSHRSHDLRPRGMCKAVVLPAINYPTSVPHGNHIVNVRDRSVLSWEDDWSR